MSLSHLLFDVMEFCVVCFHLGDFLALCLNFLVVRIMFLERSTQSKVEINQSYQLQQNM